MSASFLHEMVMLEIQGIRAARGGAFSEMTRRPFGRTLFVETTHEVLAPPELQLIDSA
jgi:hypothetical protein